MLIARKQSWLIVALIASLAVGGGYAFKRWTKPVALELKSATAYPQPRALLPFHLVDEKGTAFTEQQWQGHWSFVFFGYTSCPDVCPTTLAVFAQLARQLPPDYAGNTAFYFVSVDPERDTAKVMHDYVGFFGGAIQGVTGELPALTALAMDLGVAFNKVPQGDSYVMDHSVRAFLLNPQGERVAVFAPSLGLQGFEAGVMLQDYRSLRAH